MDFRKKLMYISIGCVCTLLGWMGASVQGGDELGEFSVLTCRALSIQDENGNDSIVMMGDMGDNGGVIILGSPDNKNGIVISNTELGYTIVILENGITKCFLGIEDGRGKLLLGDDTGNLRDIEVDN